MAVDAWQPGHPRRTVNDLKDVNDTGNSSRWTAAAIEGFGNKGIRDVADLLGQLEQSNPAQAGELAERTFQRLWEAARAKLKARVPPIRKSGPMA